MNRRTIGKGCLVCCSLLAAGCGARPELFLDAARSAAKEAVEEAIEGVVDQVTGELLDFENLSLPFNDGSGGE